MILACFETLYERNEYDAGENKKVVYKNNTFEWKDICAQNNIGRGTVYKFPCARLTPMDFFKEAKWFMTESDRVSWYNQGIQDNVVTPRIGRFGIMSSETCKQFCGEIISNRANDLLKLFSDMTSLELNHPCRICIESSFETTIKKFTSTATIVFNTMNRKLVETRATLKNDIEKTDLTKIIQQVDNITRKLNRGAIEEFFKYYVTRQLYQKLGGNVYKEKLKKMQSEEPLLPSVTPDDDDLLHHADSAFDSNNTMGYPFPKGWGGPNGGSGISLGGNPFNMASYILNTAYVNISDPDWVTKVESDPVYSWFIAGETSMVAREF